MKKNIIKKAHYTSAKTDSSTSEFNDVGLTEKYVDNFKSPYVKESYIGLGLKYNDEILLSNNCTLIIGELDNIRLTEELFDDNGSIDLSKSHSIGVDGIGNYYELELKEKHEYVGNAKLPNKI